MNRNPVARLRRRDFEAFCMFAGFGESLFNQDVINLVRHPSLPFGLPRETGDDYDVSLSESVRAELGTKGKGNRADTLLAKDAKTAKEWFTRWRLSWVNNPARERFYRDHKRLQSGETSGITDGGGDRTHNCYMTSGQRFCAYAWLNIIEFAMWRHRKDRVLRSEAFTDGDFVAWLCERVLRGEYTWQPDKPFLQWLNLYWGRFAKDEKKRLARERKYISPAHVNASGAAVSMFAFTGVDEDGHAREWSQQDLSDIVELNDYAHLSLVNRDNVFQRLPIGPERMKREYLRFRFPHVPRQTIAEWVRRHHGNPKDKAEAAKWKAEDKVRLTGSRFTEYVASRAEEWSEAIRDRLIENGVSTATIERHLDRFAVSDTADLYRRRADREKITETGTRRLSRHAEDRAKR